MIQEHHLKVLLADDHEIYLDGLQAMLQKQSNIEVVGLAANGAECIKLTESTNPDIILRRPRDLHFCPNKVIRNKIAVFFQTMFGRPAQVIKEILPHEFIRWHKVRIGDGGDLIRGRSKLPNGSRDNSFIKV